jgi:hypothetical protein
MSYELTVIAQFLELDLLYDIKIKKTTIRKWT